MHVAELWRFPVKSMAGESLGRADVRPDGVCYVARPGTIAVGDLVELIG